MDIHASTSTSTDPPAAARRLSLDELATLAGVSARTVRYYIQQGLVSRPEGAKRGAFYEQRHVEQLLLIHRWTQAGLSLERVRELCAGAPEDPPRRAAPPGSIEVWSRVTVADGLEVQIEPGRSGLSPEQVRAFVRGVSALYRQVRTERVRHEAARGDESPAPLSKENPDER